MFLLHTFFADYLQIYNPQSLIAAFQYILLLNYVPWTSLQNRNSCQKLLFLLVGIAAREGERLKKTSGKAPEFSVHRCWTENFKQS